MSDARTTIGTPTSDTERMRMRGKDTLTEIVGERTFSETFFFIVTSRMPSAAELKCFDACLNILMDHGITPNALVARLAHDSAPEDIQVAMASALLMVGNKFAGTMVGAGRLLAEGMAAGGDPREWAAETVARHRATKRRIPGFGHPYYYPDDPRAARLFQIAEDAGLECKNIDLIKILGEEIDKASGKHLTLNVTGAMGAVLSEIGFPAELMRSVAVIGRAAGLVAHIYEESQNPIVPEVVKLVNSIPYEDPN